MNALNYAKHGQNMDPFAKTAQNFLSNYKTKTLQFLSREILEETKELKGHLGEYFKKQRNYKNYHIINMNKTFF